MVQGQIAELSRRGVVAVGGPEAETFLDNLLTNNVEGIAGGHAGYGGLLSPQGKILFDFLVFRDGERFLFDLPRSAVADFVRRLTFYRLRAKVEIADLSDDHRVIAAWNSPTPPRLDGPVVVDPRLPALGFRAIIPVGSVIIAPEYDTVGEADYDAHRLLLGIPEGGMDFAYGDAFPHDADMDQLGGVAFDKGCYVGQEVVSRMEHRGTARRRLIPVRAASPIPPPGAEITADGKPVGTIASSAGGTGLAMVRLDRAREALDAGSTLMVRGMPVEIDLPDWAGFGWPSPRQAAQD